MVDSSVISKKTSNLIGAVDQGTGSSRFLVFACDTAKIITFHQIETQQIYPEAGWVEQDPLEILSSVLLCMQKSIEKLTEFEIDPLKIKAIGVTNQRESAVAWNKFTGKPLNNAIIWSDTRTARIVEDLNNQMESENVRGKCGLPISTYFSAVKLKWLIENNEEVKEAINKGDCLFGTIDTWIIWNLTGGVNDGVHVTDVTNASRTMLMNIKSLEWDPWLCNFFQIPISVLPSIRSSSEILGYLARGPLEGIPISGCLGDQSASLVGQQCFKPGSAKNTYGTGCFLLCNTGKEPVWSKHGLLTTIAYKLGSDEPVIYALEGSVAVAGELNRWLRDNLCIVQEVSDLEKLASSVASTHGVYFVPAFSGLYAPYWDTSARGVICGLTSFSTKDHIARAALEAICFQNCEIVDAMNLDMGFPLEQLKVDGEMIVNSLLMQLQADLLGIPILRPSMSECTALGIAMAAGSAKGIEVWHLNSSDKNVITTDTFTPAVSSTEKEIRYSWWKKAVTRSQNWEESTKSES